MSQLPASDATSDRTNETAAPLAGDSRRIALEAASVRDRLAALARERLWLFGAGMFVPLAYAALRYPLRGHTHELLDIGKMANYGTVEFIWYTGGLAVLFALYLLALRETRLRPARQLLPAIFGVGAVLGLAMAWMYPVNAIDMFIYAARSRLFTHYGLNPNAVRPAEYCRELMNQVGCVDPYMRYASAEWSTHLSPYGPLWNLIAAPATWLGGDSIGAALAGYKVLAFVCYLAGGWIIMRTLAVLRPAQMATGTLLYLWNPLVLWEGVGNGHNDIVLAVPLLLAALAWAKRRDALVIPLLIVGALIKYVTVLLLPLAVIAVWRRAKTWPARWRLIAWTAQLSFDAIVIGFLPWFDLAAIRAVRASIADQGRIFLTSPAAMALGFVRDDPVRYASMQHDVVRAGELIVAVVLLWQIVNAWERPRRLWRGAFEVLFVFLLVATWNFRPWYLIWPVAVVALLPWGWPAWRMIAWTAGGLALYSVFIWGWQWWDVAEGHQVSFYAVQAMGVPVVLAATLLLTIAEAFSWLAPRKPEDPGHG